MSKLGFFMMRLFAAWLCLVLPSACSVNPRFLLPIASDQKLEAFLAEEGARLLLVSENAHIPMRYNFYLVKFAREDILGLSLGGHDIFISYELTRRAYTQQGYRWLFRHTLAHEIAHDVLGHASMTHEPTFNANSITGSDLGLLGPAVFYNYSRTFELAADRKALEYWQRIGWDCRIWIAILENFLEQNYLGDAAHPTEERLRQAIEVCNSADRPAAADGRAPLTN
jgi:predicted Zn-dependent protease